jgi:hypothetical protein
MSDLVVDLRGRHIDTLDDFWDAVAEPCGLPGWFGRNVDAWHDTIHNRGISAVIDAHEVLIIHVDRAGLFAGRSRDLRDLRWAFAGRRAKLVVH